MWKTVFDSKEELPKFFLHSGQQGGPSQLAGVGGPTPVSIAGNVGGPGGAGAPGGENKKNLIFSFLTFSKFKFQLQNF